MAEVFAFTLTAPEHGIVCRGCGLSSAQHPEKFRPAVLKPRNKTDKHRPGLCRECSNVRSREYVARRRAAGLHIQRTSEQCRVHNLRKKGLSVAAYDRLLSDQDGKCAICRRVGSGIYRHGKLLPLVVDHDHVTGKMRGLLCGDCNPGLGYFKDKPELLRLAAEYLEVPRG